MLAESKAGAVEDLGPALIGVSPPLQEVRLAEDERIGAAANRDLRGQTMRPGKGLAGSWRLAVLEFEIAAVLEADLIGDARADCRRKPGHEGIQLDEVVAKTANATGHDSVSLDAGRRIPAHPVIAERQGVVVADAPVKLGEGDHLVAPARHRPGKALKEGQASVALSGSDTAGVKGSLAERGQKSRAGRSGYARKVALLLIIAEEEEEPVLDECAAQGPAELVALVGGFELDCGWD